MYGRIHACMHACMHACVYVCMYACVYACMHACMHACMYAWTAGPVGIRAPPGPRAPTINPLRSLSALQIFTTNVSARLLIITNKITRV